MDPVRKRGKDLSNSVDSTQPAPFPDEVLERVFSVVKSHKDRSSVSLVCKVWYNAERWSRRKVFIGNCYSVSPEILVRRFPNIRSVTLKGKPRFSDFNLVPHDWGADIHSWLIVFAEFYPFLEELRLKRMVVSDESLEFLAKSFSGFKALSLLSCDGFSTDGLKAIATHCKNLTELDIQENGIDDFGGGWLSCFPETFASLEVLNFASLNSDVSFDALERLVDRCKALRVLKLVPRQFAELETAFSRFKNLHTLSGLWEVSAVYLPVLYPVCANLTYLNLSYATLQSDELAKLLSNCSNLRRLWVLDTVEDKGLEAVGSSCPLLEELRVFPADPFDQADD
ncbi:protein TRANSPORT INHIBITOR RESPONSE 1-like [Heracleum sosnowskyi]|uniref:Protein TRANSPORT INHIBITOR RESPONSE 1-like n=1 Tax=Heracleum sosnowskyi TaxID=360622 RepID=A0AAD8HYA0_9APIA|nr:protein TRANSPORT INHIBITOR RESPONSE 1-like [Heracleum sosnowskyi]